MLENIIRDNELEGTFRGRREKSIYVPHSYRDRQISLITSLLEASGYIGNIQKNLILFLFFNLKKKN